MNKQELLHRTKKFAHQSVIFAMELPNNKLGWHLQGQLIRCSTSVAANYRATNLAQTTPAFISKLSIVIEEADESEFWLEFIKDQNLINGDEVNQLIKEAHELASIFISSRKTMMTKNHK